jgi:peptidoglycan/LPS O-acetylase OafA/YrhL
VSENKARIRELDALRGIAAICVVLYHYSITAPLKWINFNWGCMGVDLFFIISGFVIFMSIQKCPTWVDFALNRFSRLFPVYWACASISFLALLLTSYYLQMPFQFVSPLKTYLVNLTMLQYYFKIQDIDGSYWTLIVELCFYGFILLLLLTKKMKQIELFSSIYLLLVILNCTFYDYIQHNYVLHKVRILMPLINFFPLFFSGILFYKIKFENSSWHRVIIIGTCFIVQLYIFDKCYFNKGVIGFKEYAIVLSLTYLLFIAYYKNALHLIANKVLIKLGEISYSLYLIHQLIGTKIILPFFLFYLHMSSFLSLTAGLIIIVGLAAIINAYIEKPSLNFFRNKFSPLKKDYLLIKKGNH